MANDSKTWRCGKYELSFDRPRIMGVLNVTPDSISDGGEHFDPDAAIEYGLAMLDAGADIIDIGAESTRPGAKRVSEADEKARVLGAVDALIPEGAVLSIDTTRASVASWTATCRMWWPTIPTACTSCSIGVAGLPAPRAMCRTPTPPATSMAW